MGTKHQKHLLDIKNAVVVELSECILESKLSDDTRSYEIAQFLHDSYLQHFKPRNLIDINAIVSMISYIMSALISFKIS
ncbi:hypothetical protein IPA_02825 [Ignicoccus pacificus DSM 13166]|uniref:Uncharacterized protein n=1 Tax=Ignicoccus pacificus DSM 13166 TaxID=940294 RepID=A0A977KAU2_9CREN|nr:hypothetical protein IPA_02825 [Ignicoccus pacificus DSM 13166]